MMSEQEVMMLYRHAIERAAGYADNKALYEAHLFYAVTFGRILGIPEKDTMEAVRKEL